jgi:hypothetical protein
VEADYAGDTIEWYEIKTGEIHKKAYVFVSGLGFSQLLFAWAAMKLVWLQLREITQKWKMPPREWAAAKAQIAVVFGDRFEVNR